MSKARFFVKVGDTVLNEVIRELNRHESEHAKQLAESLRKTIDSAAIRKVPSLYERNSHLQEQDIINGEIVGILSSLRFYASIYEPKTAEVLLAAHELILRLLGAREHRNILCSKYKSQRNEYANQLADIQRQRY